MRTYLRAGLYASTVALLSLVPTGGHAQESTLLVAAADISTVAQDQATEGVSQIASIGESIADIHSGELGSTWAPHIPNIPGCRDSCQGFYRKCWGGGWYGQADALFLTRDNSSFNQPVVIDDNNPTTTLLSTGDLDFNYEPGVRVLIGTNRCGCRFCDAWEFSYFGVFDWSASATLLGNDDLSVPGSAGFGGINGLTQADEIRVDYDSGIHSFEANCVKILCESSCRRIVSLMGFRYVSLDEKFNISGNDNGPFPSPSGFYRTETNNDLYGWQIGLRDRRELRGFWGVELVGKAGIFYNHASQEQLVNDGGFVPPSPSSSDDRVAFLGELGISVLYQLTDRLSLRGGYNLFWIEGIALAPDQLDFSVPSPGSGTAIDSDGGAFLHGAHVGFEWRS